MPADELVSGERYRDVLLVAPPSGTAKLPDWSDFVSISWPAVPELHGKTFQRTMARRLVDWALDQERDQARLPAPYTALRPPAGA